MRTGDLIATGTLSGPTQKEAACLLEMAINGKEPLKDSNGHQTDKVYLKDGDVVTYQAQARGKSELGSVGFGQCSGKIVPSL